MYSIYSNQQMELLKNNQKRFSSANLDMLISKIDMYYQEFNNSLNICTQNYISVTRTIFDSLKIDTLISNEYGGKMRTTAANPEDINKVITTLDAYVKKLSCLEYLAFLKEEKRNVIFVGPNGCGKTTLLRKLITLTGDNDISYFQADRLLIVDASYNPERDMKQFQEKVSSTYHEATNVNSTNQGYYVNQQLNQMIALFEKSRFSELEHIVNGSLREENSVTTFILKTWNSLIMSRELYCDGTLKVRCPNGQDYDLKYLSSGEKNIFYFLTSILLQPKKKYYFIDEPENNLNPSIVTQLWDIIESQRPDSIFVYLTHNGEFVAERVNAKIYWIKKYDGEEWIYEALPKNNDLPRGLMVSLVGNKRPVLFCESENEDKYDAIVFKIMFPDLKVISAGGCSKVIAKTKAYKTANLPQTAFGIVDCDYRKKSFLDGQKKHNIFYLPFFEIENFLFCEEILTEMIAHYSLDSEHTLNNVISEVLADFLKTKEQFVIRNAATRLHEMGFDGKIKSLTSRQELIENYNNYCSSVSLERLFDEYEQVFDEVAKSGDLNEILRYYDNKNILNEYNKILNFRDGKTYEDEVLPFLKKKALTLGSELRRKYLPEIH